MPKDTDKAASKKGQKKLKDIKSRLSVPYASVQIGAVGQAKSFAEENPNDARAVADMLLSVLRQGHLGDEIDLPPAPQAVLLEVASALVILGKQNLVPLGQITRDLGALHAVEPFDIPLLMQLLQLLHTEETTNAREAAVDAVGCLQWGRSAASEAALFEACCQILENMEAEDENSSSFKEALGFLEVIETLASRRASVEMVLRLVRVALAWEWPHNALGKRAADAAARLIVRSGNANQFVSFFDAFSTALAPLSHECPVFALQFVAIMFEHAVRLRLCHMNRNAKSKNQGGSNISGVGTVLQAGRVAVLSLLASEKSDSAWVEALLPPSAVWWISTSISWLLWTSGGCPLEVPILLELAQALPIVPSVLSAPLVHLKSSCQEDGPVAEALEDFEIAEDGDIVSAPNWYDNESWNWLTPLCTIRKKGESEEEEIHVFRVIQHWACISSSLIVNRIWPLPKLPPSCGNELGPITEFTIATALGLADRNLHPIAIRYAINLADRNCWQGQLLLAGLLRILQPLDCGRNTYDDGVIIALNLHALTHFGEHELLGTSLSRIFRMVEDRAPSTKPLAIRAYGKLFVTGGLTDSKLEKLVAYDPSAEVSERLAVLGAIQDACDCSPHVGAGSFMGAIQEALKDPHPGIIVLSLRSLRAICLQVDDDLRIDFPKVWGIICRKHQGLLTHESHIVRQAVFELAQEYLTTLEPDARLAELSSEGSPLSQAINSALEMEAPVGDMGKFDMVALGMRSAVWRCIGDSVARKLHPDIGDEEPNADEEEAESKWGMFSLQEWLLLEARFGVGYKNETSLNDLVNYVIEPILKEEREQLGRRAGKDVTTNQPPGLQKTLSTTKTGDTGCAAIRQIFTKVVPELRQRQEEHKKEKAKHERKAASTANQAKSKGKGKNTGYSGLSEFAAQDAEDAKDAAAQRRILFDIIEDLRVPSRPSQLLLPQTWKFFFNRYVRAAPAEGTRPSLVRALAGLAEDYKQCPDQLMSIAAALSALGRVAPALVGDVTDALLAFLESECEETLIAAVFCSLSYLPPGAVPNFWEKCLEQINTPRGQQVRQMAFFAAASEVRESAIATAPEIFETLVGGLSTASMYGESPWGAAFGLARCMPVYFAIGPHNDEGRDGPGQWCERIAEILLSMIVNQPLAVIPLSVLLGCICSLQNERDDQELIGAIIEKSSKAVFPNGSESCEQPLAILGLANMLAVIDKFKLVRQSALLDAVIKPWLENPRPPPAETHLKPWVNAIMDVAVDILLLPPCLSAPRPQITEAFLKEQIAAVSGHGPPGYDVAACTLVGGYVMIRSRSVGGAGGSAKEILKDGTLLQLLVMQIAEAATNKIGGIGNANETSHLLQNQIIVWFKCLAASPPLPDLGLQLVAEPLLLHGGTRAAAIEFCAKHWQTDASLASAVLNVSSSFSRWPSNDPARTVLVEVIPGLSKVASAGRWLDVVLGLARTCVSQQDYPLLEKLLGLLRCHQTAVVNDQAILGVATCVPANAPLSTHAALGSLLQGETAPDRLQAGAAPVLAQCLAVALTNDSPNQLRNLRNEILNPDVDVRPEEIIALGATLCYSCTVNLANKSSYPNLNIAGVLREILATVEMNNGQEKLRAPRAILLSVIILGSREAPFRILFDKFLNKNFQGITTLIWTIRQCKYENSFPALGSNVQEKKESKKPVPERLLQAADAIADKISKERFVNQPDISVKELEKIATSVFFEGHISDRPDISHAVGGGQEHNLDWLASFLQPYSKTEKFY